MTNLDELMLFAKYGDVVDRTDWMLSLNPDDETALRYKAEALYNLRDYEKSLEVINHALKLNFGDSKLLNLKLYIFIYLDRLDEAFDFYNEIKDKISLNSFEVEFLARSLSAKRKYSESLECYERVLEIEPDNLDVVDEVKTLRNILAIKPERYYMSWIYKITGFRRSLKCPFCGNSLIPIVYGMPLEETLRKADAGEVIIGGCCITGSDPVKHCKSCGVSFVKQACKITVETEDVNEFRYIIKSLNWLDELIATGGIEKELLKDGLGQFSAEEMGAFVNHLLDIGYLVETCDGCFSYGKF